MFYPNTVMEILGLDKLEKDNIKAQQCPNSTFFPFINMVSQIPPIPLAPRTTHINHLSKVEIRAHREKGSCYNCDEKLTQVH